MICFQPLYGIYFKKLQNSSFITYMRKETFLSHPFKMLIMRTCSVLNSMFHKERQLQCCLFTHFSFSEIVKNEIRQVNLVNNILSSKFILMQYCQLARYFFRDRQLQIVLLCKTYYFEMFLQTFYVNPIIMGLQSSNCNGSNFHCFYRNCRQIGLNPKPTPNKTAIN